MNTQELAQKIKDALLASRIVNKNDLEITIVPKEEFEAIGKIGYGLCVMHTVLGIQAGQTRTGGDEAEDELALYCAMAKSLIDELDAIVMRRIERNGDFLPASYAKQLYRSKRVDGCGGIDPCATGVRLTHEATGLTAEADEDARSLARNEVMAGARLAEKIKAYLLAYIDEMKSDAAGRD